MELIPVTCNHCGAALEIPQSARFVTCRYCNSQLEIKRNESTISTEVLERIDQNTTAMAEDLHAIRRESEIERLDREWLARRESLMLRSKDGSLSTPASSIIPSIIGIAFGIVWTIGATAMVSGASAAGAPGFVAIFPLFGLVFIAAGIFTAVKSSTSAKTYADEERQYQARRQELLAAHEESPAARE